MNHQKVCRRDWDKLITVQLTVAEAWHLRSAALSQARKRRHELLKSDFVPAPGKQNANQVQAELLESGSKKLTGVLR